MNFKKILFISLFITSTSFASLPDPKAPTDPADAGDLLIVADNAGAAGDLLIVPIPVSGMDELLAYDMPDFTPQELELLEEVFADGRGVGLIEVEGKVLIIVSAGPGKQIGDGVPLIMADGRGVGLIEMDGRGVGLILADARFETLDAPVIYALLGEGQGRVVVPLLGTDRI